MTDRRTRRRAHVLWWMLPLLLYPIYLLLLGVLVSGLDFEDGIEVFTRDGVVELLDPTDGLSFYWFHLPALVMSVAQWLLLAPVAGPLRTGDRSKSIRMAIVGGALLGATLTVAFVATLVELPALALEYGLIAEKPVGVHSIERMFDHPAGVVGIAALGWIGWTALLVLFIDAHDQRTPSRIVRALFAGTVVELVLAIPVYAMLRRKDDCWCAMHSFWAVVAGCAALVVLTGPGVAIVMHRRRRGITLDRCLVCGQARGGAEGARCPECGTRWGRPFTEPEERERCG